jgi:hypothetical protein
MKIKLLLFVLFLISLNTYSQVSSGSFSVGGSSASYYPVSFSVSGVDGTSSLGKLSVYIDNVHANGSWTGMFHSDIEFISSNYGHIATKIVEFTYITGGGNAYSDPIGDIIDGSTQAGGSQLVIWLKGAATYQWSTTFNSRVTLIDGNPEGSAKTSCSGGALNILTAQSELMIKAKNAKFYQSVGLGTSGNGYFGGNVGIGTTNPTGKLEISGGNIIINRPSNKIDRNGISEFSAFEINNSFTPGQTGYVKVFYPSFNNLLFGADYDGNIGGVQPNIQFGRKDQPFLTVVNNGGYTGNIGIGTTNPDEKLTVNGVIHAKEVKVDLSGPLADYVFKPDYKLMSLPQVEKFVKENNHLPQMPSAEEVTKNGLSMGEMQNKLLQKVEEQTLYIIELNKQVQTLKKQLEKLENK